MSEGGHGWRVDGWKWLVEQVIGSTALRIGVV